MTPFVVDANAIHAFQQERISQAQGVAHQAMDAILAGNCLALDEERLCLQEWLDCAGGKFPFALMDWVGDQMVTGKLRYFPLASNACRRDLQQHGLPQKDHKWVRLALGCAGRRLVSGDIDFFDPRLKNAPAAAKERARNERKGQLCKMLRKSYGVEVMCLEHVVEEVAQLES